MSSLGLLANFFPDAGSGGSSHPLGLPVRKPLPSGDDPSTDRMGLLNSGGLSDTLLGLGAGLLSSRNWQEGLGQGFQNAIAMNQMAQNNRRRDALDKLAADREARMAAGQDWLRQHQTERAAAEDAQRAATMGLQREQFDFTRTQANKPELIEVPQADNTVRKEWRVPGAETGVAVGAPVPRTADTHVVGGALVDNAGKVIYQAPRDSGLSPDAIEFAANQGLAGDTSYLVNLGRGAQGGEAVKAIKNRMAEIAKERGVDASGMLRNVADFAGQKAASRTLGTQEANSIAAGTEALGALKIGRDVSATLPRSNWVPANMAVQAWQRGTSNPQLAAFGQAAATIANTYARAVNPKGLPHQTVVNETLHRLSATQGPEAFNAMLDVMQKEIDMAQRSPAQARKTLEGLKSGAQSSASPEAQDYLRQNPTASNRIYFDAKYGRGAAARILGQ